MICLGVECMRQVCVLWCAMNTRTSRPAGHRSVSARNTRATILLHLYDYPLKIVFRRPNNGTFGPLSHVHISGLYRYHSKSIFLFITFDFVKVTIKSSIQACPTINFVHYVKNSHFATACFPGTIFLPNSTQVLTKFLPTFTSVEDEKTLIRFWSIFGLVLECSTGTFSDIGLTMSMVRRHLACEM